jgi:Phytanoyl-CoA dioxygenase (PhyH)
MFPRLRDTEAQRRFAREGYAVFPLLDRELPRLREMVADIQATLRTDPRWQPRGFDELMYVEDRELRRAVQSEVEWALLPRLAEHVHDPHILVSNVLVKAPAPAANVVPPHQDYCVVDEPSGFEHAQVWVPLVDVNRVNGCLGVVPRTHRFSYPYRAQGDKTAFESFADRLSGELVHWLPLRAGEAVLFAGRTVHASDKNRSAHFRPSVACFLTPADAPLVHYHRLTPTRVEVFRLERDELRNIMVGVRPEVGRSVGFVDHTPTDVSYDEFRRVTADP